MSQSVPPQTYPCALACELLDRGQSHIGRLRWISLSYCFVEITGFHDSDGREVALRIPGGAEGRDSTVNAILSGPPHTVETPTGESSPGLDLALQHVDGNFFAILQAARQTAPETFQEPTTGTWTRAGELGGSPSRTDPPAPSTGTPPPPIDDEPESPRSGTWPDLNQRRSERRDVHIPVRLWGSGREIEGTVRNISKHGAFIETPTPIPNAAELHIELDLPVRAFHYEGIVVNQRTSEEGLPKGVGMRFVPIEEMLDTAPGTGPKLRSQTLSVDLSDPARLARVYLAEIRHGGLCVRSSDRYLEGTQVRVDLRLPPPHGAFPVFARVLPAARPNHVLVELLDPGAVKDRVRSIIEEHRAR